GILVGLAALGAAGLLLVSGCGSDSASLPSGVVARVGDAQITEKQLTALIDQNRTRAKQSGQTLPAVGEDGYVQVRQQALQALIQQQVVTAEARKCGTPCAVTPANIDAELVRIRAASFQGSQKKFDAFLKKSGISTSGAREIVTNNL
ncbi:unnamed protein product, partial [Phaeothamnion confervicola]